MLDVKSIEELKRKWSKGLFVNGIVKDNRESILELFVNKAIDQAKAITKAELKKDLIKKFENDKRETLFEAEFGTLKNNTFYNMAMNAAIEITKES